MHITHVRPSCQKSAISTEIEVFSRNFGGKNKIKPINFSSIPGGQTRVLAYYIAAYTLCLFFRNTFTYFVDRASSSRVTRQQLVYWLIKRTLFGVKMPPGWQTCKSHRRFIYIYIKITDSNRQPVLSFARREEEEKKSSYATAVIAVSLRGQICPSFPREDPI